MCAADKEILFNDQLPKWESFIYSQARRLISTRVIDRGLYGIEDIQQLLRIALWRAIEKYEDNKDCSLTTWIVTLLKQRCSLLVESQYHKVPRNEEGTPLYPEPLYYSTEKGETIKEFEDKATEVAFTDWLDEEWLNGVIGSFKSILEQRKGYHEEQILRALLSGKYETDTAIADALGINFAQVSAFHVKLKMLYCLLNDLPVEKASGAANRHILFQRLKNQFQPYSKNDGLLLVQNKQLNKRRKLNETNL